MMDTNKPFLFNLTSTPSTSAAPAFSFNQQNPQPQASLFNLGNSQTPLFNFGNPAPTTYNFNGAASAPNQSSLFNFNTPAPAADNFDIQSQYKNIAQKFLDHYYKTYDSTPTQLGALFSRDSLITYINNDMAGSTKLVEYINSMQSSFKHENITFSAQPFKTQRILIVVTGVINVIRQGMQTKHNFSESIMLFKDMNKATNQSSFFVENLIFKIL